LFDILGGKSQHLIALNRCLVDVESGELERPWERLQALRERFPEVGMEGLSSHTELALAACAAARQQWDVFDDCLSTAAARLLARGVREPELAGLAVIAAREASQHDPERARRALDLATSLGGVERYPARAVEYDRLVGEL
jgi:hypothetical protein